MTVQEYENFDVCIEGAAGSYKVRTSGGALGERRADIEWNITKEQFNAFLYEIGKPRHRARRARSKQYEAAKQFGGQLHDTLFVGEVLAGLQRSLQDTETKNKGCRLRFMLSDAPELRDLPWEMLFDRSRNHFLALYAETPIVRYLHTPEPIKPLAVTPPLKILVVISSPSALPPLDVEREWNNLQEALADLKKRQLVELERIEAAQLATLNRRLSRDEFHVLHFIGHGEYDVEAERGELAFEDTRGKAHYVPADTFAAVVKGCRSLRLVVLNSCDGARDAPTDPFAGTAQALVQRGIPAVIAMQFEITDDAAIVLASSFYSFLAVGLPIDASLSQARRTIFAGGNEVEWATPVLYLRAPDGQIFEVAQTDEVRQQAASNDANRSNRDADALDERLRAAEWEQEKHRAAAEKKRQDEQAEAAERERERIREARLREERAAEERAWQARQAAAREQAERDQEERAEERRRMLIREAQSHTNYRDSWEEPIRRKTGLIRDWKLFAFLVAFIITIGVFMFVVNRRNQIEYIRQQQMYGGPSPRYVQPRY